MSNETTKKDRLASINSKKMLKELADKKVVVKRNERLKVEIVKDTKHYKKGQVVTPHVTFGKELVKQGLAKEVK